MTPQQFVDSIDIPETRRRIAIVAAMPLHSVSQWICAVRAHLGINYDRYSFRINPMRLHAFIDGYPEPRLAITFYDPMDERTTVPTSTTDPDLIFIREISL